MLTSGLKYSVQNDGELIIRHAQYNDGGAYECVARTSRERVEAFTNLVVRGARRLRVVSYFGERQRHKYLLNNCRNCIMSIKLLLFPNQLFCNIVIIMSNFSSSKPIESLRTCISMTSLRHQLAT